MRSAAGVLVRRGGELNRRPVRLRRDMRGKPRRKPRQDVVDPGRERVIPGIYQHHFFLDSDRVGLGRVPHCAQRVGKIGAQIAGAQTLLYAAAGSPAAEC